jgi:N-acylneuraminate cytidylyltransferase
MKFAVLICARGGSKGLPGKNIKPLNGIPLIGWSIGIAKQLNRVSRIIVSTDSEEIAKVALEHGAEVPFMRPEELAQDSSPEWLVWRHAIKFVESHDNENYDAIISLPVTAPLRSVGDIDKCIDLFEEGGIDSVITVSEASRSPYFNMTVNDGSGFSKLVIPPKNQISRRQDAPEVFDMTTVAYVVSTNFVKCFNGIFEGKVKSIVVPRERAIDIDELMDFKIAECLLMDEYSEKN